MAFLKHTWGRFRAWWIRRRLLTKIAMIAIVVIVLFVALGGRKKDPVVETVKQQDLARTVSATGTVTSTTDLNLSFQQSGTIASVNVSVGQKVVKGQVLATLSAGDAHASLTTAQGALLAAQAREQKVIEGSSDTEIQKATVTVENTRRTLYSQGLEAVPDDLNNAGGDAPVLTGVYRGTDQGQYNIFFDTSTNQARFTGLEKGIVVVSKTPVPLGTSGLMIAFPSDRDHYTLTDSWTIAIPNVNAATYTANLNAYRAAQADLATVQAHARSADVAVAHADVVSAEGQVQSAQAAIEKTVIRAPASGTVTKIDMNVGDAAESYKPVITLQDIDHLYVEANVNESDVSNIAVGQPITITYDAFGKGTTYNASVTSIDLAPTVTDGIVNYKIKAQIQETANVRPGMTANLSIQTAYVQNALVIPDRTITQKNGTQTVQVLTDARKDTTSVRTITTGLKGDGGLVEVTSGLAAGDQVVFTP